MPNYFKHGPNQIIVRSIEYTTFPLKGKAPVKPPSLFTGGSLRVIAFFAVFLMPLANAATYYVAPNGSDGNPGTLSLPWRTIAKAANTLVAGDAVHIRAGTYKEQVTPKNSGNASGFITYAAYPGESVTIDASNGLNWKWKGVFDLKNRGYLQISGLRIINSPGFGIFMSGSNNMRILNNYTYHTYYSGIYAHAGKAVTINGNEVELANVGGSQEAITLNGVTNFIVSNNHVHGGAMEGIDARASSFTRIFGNTIHDMARVGIYIDNYNGIPSHIDIYENRVYDSKAAASGASEDGIRIGAEEGGAVSRINIYNNVLYNLAGSGISVSNYTVPGSPQPQFSNISIYNNTVYNAGTRASNYGGGIDIQGSSASGIIIRNNILRRNRFYPIRLATGIPPANVTISHNLIDKSTAN
jgi:parallel beta-helix repeat protein